ncbi:docking protein 2 isoform X2 [Hippocampus zosterae]|uniref:docking protein 2 isoform X2 n=1 Tax=Hippocampus zosterae TaxID=109293 RepID=UPI00223E36FA|nr:docking protein 2 isoform X2 [Hippocampus zosterae]
MDEDVKKEGNVYLQHHRFGKKWKSMWCVLFRESSSSISRLELWEIKDGGSGEKKQRSGRKHTKVIRLSDLVRVSTNVQVEACPADSAPFLLETVDKVVVLAARADHVNEWATTLCQLAFPVSWEESKSREQQQKQDERRGKDQEGMEDNALYSSTTDPGRDFRVHVRRTASSERCSLKGDGVLRASVDALHLLDSQGVTLMSWPYRFLRRFGRDKSCFSVEAGRRSASGEGNFEFDTKEGHSLFQAVETAISIQRARQTSGGMPMRPDRSRKAKLPPLPPTPSSAAQVALAPTVVGVSGLTLDDSRGLVSVNCCPSSPDTWYLDPTYSQVSFPAPCTPPCTASPSEQEYSEVMLNPTRLCDEGPEGHATAPLYRRADHIYDEPQVKDSRPPRAPPSEYDIPEELKGDAWKVMAAPADPRSHLYSTPKRGRGDHHVTVQEMPEEAHKLYNNVMAGCQCDNSDDKII